MRCGGVGEEGGLEVWRVQEMVQIGGTIAEHISIMKSRIDVPDAGLPTSSLSQHLGASQVLLAEY